MQRVFMAPVLQRKVEVVDRVSGAVPKGFVGVMLVFDSEEAAAVWAEGETPMPMLAPNGEDTVTH